MGTIDFAPLWITLKTGIVASVFSFFIGIAFAELVINTKGRVRAFWDGLLTLPMVLPPTVAGYILLRIFSTRRPFGSFLSNSMGIQVVHTWLGCVVGVTPIREVEESLPTLINLVCVVSQWFERRLQIAGLRVYRACRISNLTTRHLVEYLTVDLEHGANLAGDEELKAGDGEHVNVSRATSLRFCASLRKTIRVFRIFA